MSRKTVPTRIKLTREDHARLEGLASASMDRFPDVAARLADAVDRAQVLSGARPAGLAGMGSRVEYRDESTGRSQSVTLVYPGDADIAQGRVSVLTPIGAALVGRPEGKSVEWETRTGEVRKLTVLGVTEAVPEPA